MFSYTEYIVNNYISTLFVFQGVWIRQGAVGFVAVVAKTLNIADVHCKLLPQVNPFLKHQVLQLDNEVNYKMQFIAFM